MTFDWSPKQSVLLSAALFSTAGLFVGVLDMNVWAILFWRSLFAAIFASIPIVAQRNFAVVRFDRAGLLATVLSASATLAFIPALRLTSVANVAVIHGSLPLVTLVLSGAIASERIDRRAATLCLAVAMGAIIIFAGSASEQTSILGDGLALVMTVFMALMTIAIRRSKVASVLPMVTFSNVIAMLVAWAMAPNLAINPEDAVIVVSFALFQITFGLIFYAHGARLLLPTETALLSLCEVPLSAFWAWLAFDQKPGVPTYLGGGVILMAVLVHLTPSVAQSAQKERGK